MLVVALVVVVVNAQLTWWLVYSLRENRVRLRLEREQLGAACEEVAARIDSGLDGALIELLQATASGLEPGIDPPPAPFETVERSRGSVRVGLGPRGGTSPAGGGGGGRLRRGPHPARVD